MKNEQNYKDSNKMKKLSSIRWKLMLFAIILCIVVILLVWVMNVQLLVPMYNNSIESSLESTAQKYMSLIVEHGDIQDESTDNGINAQFFEQINLVASQDNDLAGKCLDISDSSGNNILHMHQFAGNCILHPVQKNMFGDSGYINWNTQSTVAMRKIVLENGDAAFTLNQEYHDQRVTAKNINGEYTLFVSTDLDRIDQAAQIIQMQMPMIAVVVLLIGIAGAVLFSRRFSKPILEISNAAKIVAAGDYNVRIKSKGNDEIAVLANDFNTMAHEISRSSQLQKDLMANISHDLRTPLTLIKGYAETLRDLTGDNKEKRNEQLNIIVDETDRLSGIVNGVMELSKISSGTRLPEKMNFNIAQLCEEVALLYEDVCEKNGYKLIIDAPVECEVFADPEQLSRVIHNFMSNALHHIGNDNVLKISCLPQDDKSVKIEVTDHGQGIAPEDLPHIFDRYYRARESSGKQGAGLGLSISKAILQNHNLRYGVHSKLGQGSTFWFSINLVNK